LRVHFHGRGQVVCLGLQGSLLSACRFHGKLASSAGCEVVGRTVEIASQAVLSGARADLAGVFTYHPSFEPHAPKRGWRGETLQQAWRWRMPRLKREV